MSMPALMIILSLILICSFFYNYLLEKFRIPPVLLLILTGIILKQIANLLNINFVVPNGSLPLFGTLGLIAIVLEASFDLKISKTNNHIMIRALIMTVTIMFISAGLIAYLFMWFFQVQLLTGLLYAAPFAIVSSAIVIPSVGHITAKKKDLLIFESIFSDVIGILAFNFILVSEFHSVFDLAKLTISMLLMLVISMVISVLLIFVINRNNQQNRHVFILAVLVMAYATAELCNLSALLLILIFGMTLNSIEAILKHSRYAKFFNFSGLEHELHDMRSMTSTFAFIIRSIFFVLFGYMIDIKLLVNLNVIYLGLSVVIISYVVRFYLIWVLNYRNPVRQHLTESLIAPRGLVTVLLFYQIPDRFNINNFNSGVVFFVIILTGLIMSSSLIFEGKNKK